MAPQLKLIALDADDLAVISAHVQDARVAPADITARSSASAARSFNPAIAAPNRPLPIGNL